MADISTDDAIHPDLCRADVLNCLFKVAQFRSDRPIDDVGITSHRGERITNQREGPSCGFQVTQTPHNAERIRKRQDTSPVIVRRSESVHNSAESS